MCVGMWLTQPGNQLTPVQVLDVMPGHRVAAWFNLTSADQFEVV